MFTGAIGPFCFDVECHLFRQPLELTSCGAAGMDSLNHHIGGYSERRQGRSEGGMNVPLHYLPSKQAKMLAQYISIMMI